MILLRLMRSKVIHPGWWSHITGDTLCPSLPLAQGVCHLKNLHVPLQSWAEQQSGQSSVPVARKNDLQTFPTALNILVV